MNPHATFRDLCDSIHGLGYTEPVPPIAEPIVRSLFNDFLCMAHDLVKARKDLNTLEEQKSLWMMGIQPYKCDNARLVQENMSLHEEIQKQQEIFQQKTMEQNNYMRELENEKIELERRCTRLEDELRNSQQQRTQMPCCKTSREIKNCREGKESCGAEVRASSMRRPFVTAVRSGSTFPPPAPLKRGQSFDRDQQKLKRQISSPNLRNASPSAPSKTADDPQVRASTVIAELELRVAELTDLITFCQRQLEARNHEISRLKEMLNGGRPPSALMKDCCCKEVIAAHEETNRLKSERGQLLKHLQTMEEQMNAVLELRLDAENRNRELEQELDELRTTALKMEDQANETVRERDIEIEHLRRNLDKLHEVVEQKNAQYENSKVEARVEVERLLKIISKLERKIKQFEKVEKKVTAEQLLANIPDDEAARLRLERDYFHREYLYLLSKAAQQRENMKRDYELLESDRNNILEQLKSRTEIFKNMDIELDRYKDQCMQLRERVQDLEGALADARLGIPTATIEELTREKEDKEIQTMASEEGVSHHQLDVLTKSLDEAMAENERSTNLLTSSQTELLIVQERLKQTEDEIDRLKRLLIDSKNNEVAIMEHALCTIQQNECDNQGNGGHAVEGDGTMANFKTIIFQLQHQINDSRKKIANCHDVIRKMEEVVSALRTENIRLDLKVNDTVNDQGLLRVELATRKDLCEQMHYQIEELKSKLAQQQLAMVNHSEVKFFQTLDDILTRTCGNLEQQRHDDERLRTEVAQLREQNDNFLYKLRRELLQSQDFVGDRQSPLVEEWNPGEPHTDEGDCGRHVTHM